MAFCLYLMHDFVMDEVNESLPRDERFEITMLWWPTTEIKLWRTHRALHPESRLRRYYLIMLAAAILWMFLGLTLLNLLGLGRNLG